MKQKKLKKEFKELNFLFMFKNYISNNRQFFSIFKYFLFLVIFLFSLPLFSEDEDFEIVRKGVIQIKVFSQKYDAFSPWQTKKIQASTGTGFLITKDKILTNAHVISNAKFIQVQRYNQTTWYEVDVLHVAHDCDLAILKAKDPNFYEDSHVFELGDIPELNSPISVVGYPIGGDKISVTRGIVSRKEQSTYAHSQVDSHLVIQVDAAINPGNSGGPAIQGDKVVGVAFQVATRGENIGYLIPTTVVKYFLKDVEDGKYDGYVELGIRTLNSYNETFRKLMNIPDKMDGVFVTKVLRGGSAEGHLKVDDLLTEIDGLSIGRNGTVLFDKDARVDFVEIVDNKHSGEIIYLKVFREGKLIDINFPAKKMLQFNFMRHQYNEPYNYFQIGGLVFQPVSRDLIGEWLKNRETQGGSQLLFRFFHFIEEDLGEGKFKEDIVFYRRLAHPVNSSAQYYVNLILESVNGIEVKDINHLKEICSNSKETFFRFKFRDVQSPLVLKSEALLKANKDIQKLYGIITKKDPAKKNKQQNGKS